MITQDSVLVQLIVFIERIPSPPPPLRRRRGRPTFYSEKLFIKALVIMIVRRLHIGWESSWRSLRSPPPR
jgi:hypothetical protein